MKRIDKANFLATAFLNELHLYEQGNHGNHPRYNRSAFRDRNYTSVYFALLICQRGVCAYTESELFRDFNLLNIGWNNGVYQGVYINRTGFRGTIDHFDSTIKTTRGWELNNLFLVQNDINSDKGTKVTYHYLNPSNPNYNPNDYLFYSFSQHKFYPKKGLNSTVKRQVKKMIVTLGLNAPSIVSERKGYLNGFKVDFKKQIKSINQINQEHYKFFTAFDMSLSAIQGIGNI